MSFNVGFSLKFLITYSPRHPSGATFRWIGTGSLFAKRGDGGESVKLPIFMLFSFGLFYQN